MARPLPSSVLCFSSGIDESRRIKRTGDHAEKRLFDALSDLNGKCWIFHKLKDGTRWGGDRGIRQIIISIYIKYPHPMSYMLGK